jgi:hypothetical protein
MKLSSVLVCLSLLVGSLASGGFAEEEDNSEALAFNKAVLEANARLHDGGIAYGKALLPLLRGEAVDSRELKRQLDNLGKIHESVLADMQQARAPDSDAARAFQKSHQKFLEGQQVLIEADLPLVGRIAEDATLTPAVKQEKVQAILDSMDARETQTHRDLLEAQKAFAAAHNFSIKEQAEKQYTVWVYRKVNGKWVKQEDRTLVTKSLEKAREYAASVKKFEGWTATSNIPEQ